MTADLPTILLLGDSLTQLAFEGWGAKLAHLYQRRADVINRGCSGYNTEFYRRLPLPPAQAVHPVCLAVIFFGANDAALPDQNPHHYVSVEDYTRNLNQLIDRVREQYSDDDDDDKKNSNSSSPRILLIAPPPLDHDKRLAYQVERYGDKATGVLERTTENTQRYAQACAHVAAGRGNNLAFLNLFDKMLAEPDYGRFLNDGLHFSAAGHDFVADAVLETIRTDFPELAVTPCPFTGQWNNSGSTSGAALTSWGAYHDEIDHTNVDAAFRKEQQNTS